MPTPTDARNESSHLGKSFHFKGEITGAEDVFIDGEVEGTIQLPAQSVTVGPNGRVNAQIHARELTVHGKLNGNSHAQDRVEITRTGSVCGDLSMTRISIQDGAFIQGRVDIRLPDARPIVAPQPPAPPLTMGVAAPGAVPLVRSPDSQPSLLDRKF